MIRRLFFLILMLQMAYVNGNPVSHVVLYPLKTCGWRDAVSLIAIMCLFNGYVLWRESQYLNNTHNNCDDSRNSGDGDGIVPVTSPIVVVDQDLREESMQEAERLAEPIVAVDQDLREEFMQEAGRLAENVEKRDDFFTWQNFFFYRFNWEKLVDKKCKPLCYYPLSHEDSSACMVKRLNAIQRDGSCQAAYKQYYKELLVNDMLCRHQDNAGITTLMKSHI